MKNQYFTKENILTESLKMLNKLGYSKGSRRKFDLNENAALIVTDMQNYFLDEKSHAFVPSALPIIPGVKKIIKAFVKKEMLVIFTRHTNNKTNAGAMSSWWSDLMDENSPLSEIHNDFDLSNSVILEKHQYDAFYQTELKTILNQRNIRQLIVTGVLTHLCCETTVRSAFVNGFDVFFPINGTATYRRKYHKSTFNNISHGFAIPCLIEDLITQIDNL